MKPWGGSDSGGRGKDPGTPEFERVGPMTSDKLRRLDLELANKQPTQTSAPPHPTTTGGDPGRGGAATKTPLRLVGCFGFNSPLRQYFSLYRAVSQREGERGEKG